MGCKIASRDAMSKVGFSYKVEESRMLEVADELCGDESALSAGDIVIRAPSVDLCM